MHRLELKIPPVALFLIALLLEYRCFRDLTFAAQHLPWPSLVFFVCFSLAGLLGISGLYEFWKMKTTVSPTQPHKASAMVASGIFRFSRNPMYLGLFLLLFGVAYWQQNIVSLMIPL